jgi:predicted dienelactone hydrolase
MKTHLLFLAALFPINLAQAEPDVGAMFLKTAAAHQTREIDTAVFYPAQGGRRSVMGENGVFYGVEVHEGADPVPGKHPVVLLSHGWGGNYRRMGWLSTGLAERGAIVIAVNHPGSTTGETGNLDALNHWTRAQDLSAALDRALADPVLGALIDEKHISAAGFSYGGWTALSLAGLKGSRDGLDRFCNDPAKAISHCADILKAGIVIGAIDKVKWETSYKDRRISSVAAIDPALTWGLSTNDTAELDVPMLLIGLGKGKDRLHATDTSRDGSGFEALVPGARVETIAPAAHFTALGRCKPAGAAILAEERDDPVCSDPAGTDREVVTERIVEALADHFGLGQ